MKNNDNEKTKCSLRGERDAVAKKAKPKKLLVEVVERHCILIRLLIVRAAQGAMHSMG